MDYKLYPKSVADEVGKAAAEVTSEEEVATEEERVKHDLRTLKRHPRKGV